MQRSSLLLVLVMVLSGPGCGGEPRDIAAGAHHLSVTVPDGWEYLNHGLEHLVGKKSAQISIKDLGPVTTLGYVAEVEAARELWRQGKVPAARDRIQRIQIPRRPGSSNQEYREFRKLWWQLTSDLTLANPDSVEQDYARVLDALGQFSEVELEDLVDRALVLLDHDQRRDIATRKRVTLEGREFLVVDTWDRLSHDYRRRHAFVINQGHLLVVWTKRGLFSEVEGPFTDLLQSLSVRALVEAPKPEAAGP